MLAAATLWVDPNVAPASGIFSTIGAAVAAAHAGDTVTVLAGTYAGSVVVNKTLTLIGGQVRAGGEPVGPTVLDANSASFGFDVVANGVTIKNFTIKRSFITGVLVEASVSGANILNDTFLDDNFGVA